MRWSPFDIPNNDKKVTFIQVRLSVALSVSAPMSLLLYVFVVNVCVRKDTLSQFCYFTECIDSLWCRQSHRPSRPGCAGLLMQRLYGQYVRQTTLVIILGPIEYRIDCFNRWVGR